MDIDRLYRRLGVEEPKHIDIRAVAFELGLEVQFANLRSCEARIIGSGQQGIITVQEGVHRLRQRFSIAHEIGHWAYHRGKALVCRQSDIGDGWEMSRHRERVADEFASKLLLPSFLLKPRLGGIRRLTFADVARLGTEFRVSKTATARRLVELDCFASMLIGYSGKGRRWFARSKLIPEHWLPALDLDSESDALRCVFSGLELGRPSKIGADAFFERRGADRYEILEESILVGHQEVVTLLTFIDERMLRDE